MSAGSKLPWTLAVFLLGLVLGGGAAHLYHKKALAELLDGGGRAFHERIKHKFMDDMDLDAVQRQRLEPILNGLNEKIRTVRRQVEPEIRKHFAEVRPHIMEVLTPGQVKKFEDMEARMKKRKAASNATAP
jgi:Spy/CpxP family protein refolding chaperone